MQNQGAIAITAKIRLIRNDIIIPFSSSSQVATIFNLSVIKRGFQLSTGKSLGNNVLFSSNLTMDRC